MKLFHAYTAPIVLAGALALSSGIAASSDAPEFVIPDRPAGEEERIPDDASSAKRLNRVWAEHDARRAEDAARREAEISRQNEINRARGALSSYGRRESFLRHESYWQRREFDWITRDPADVSAMARGGAVERELRDTRSQLESALSGRQDSLRQLDTLRVR